ncbi:ATP-binding protein [Pedobacter sp. B4-66]|uniref:ATP-binding protein n=1 Tax=Pedobacter sp. B4-66 TaxID=2817280 RepID=UPI001BDAA10A|nr:ATP-binding protein [Pedobacter sp. B4-66]
MNYNDTTPEVTIFKTFTDQNAPEELRYLEQLILYRLSVWFPSDENTAKPVLDLTRWSGSLSDFIEKHRLSADEASLLLIGLTPHLQSDLFDRVIGSKLQNSGDFQRIGGVRGKDFRGFLPTGETALFLLGGDDFNRRLEIQKLFWADHLFEKNKVLWLDDQAYGEPAMSGKIILSPEYLDTFIYGKTIPPRFSISFPAKLIHTDLTWDDLVINDELKEQINELKSWLKYNDQLVGEWGMGDRLRKGYRTLLYGPSGTGKTFTAGLLGKEVGKDVYKIDLSMVVSKYIGETEKNLELLFARAEDKGWILFFDEADALFGKRTNVRDAHDKYANQEVSYLLQRIEDYNGMVILATNMKNNIDDAFIRRFNSILKFTVPEADERAKIWRSAFPQDVIFCNGQNEVVDIPEVVKSYAISGGCIVNIVHYSSIKALERYHEHNGLDQISHENGEIAMPSQKTIYLTDVLYGIKKELFKEGKPFS